MQTTPGLSLWRGRSMKEWFLPFCTTAGCIGRKINNNRKLPGIQGSAGRDTSKNKAQKSEFDFCAFWIDWKRWKNAVKFIRISRHSGPSVEIRTRGLLNPIQARYQTSPHPDAVSISLVIIPWGEEKSKRVLKKRGKYMHNFFAVFRSKIG